MTCFSDLLSCWTRPWRCRKVQQLREFLDLCSQEAPKKVHHPLSQVDDADTVPVDLDGTSANRHKKFWKLNRGNGAFGLTDLHGALAFGGLDVGTYAELYPEHAKRGKLGELKLGWIKIGLGTYDDALQQAAKNGDFDEAQSLLVASVDVNSSDEQSVTPLQVACAEGNLEMVRLFVSHGSSVNRLDVLGHGPLWHAAQQGHGEIIEFLIREGAVVNSIDQFLVRDSTWLWKMNMSKYV
eukprot:s460_g4.t1